MKGLSAVVGYSLAVRAVAALNAKSITSNYFGNDAPWYLDRIPLFETSESEIQDVYYYRWNIFRAHQRDLGNEGYISTEFLNDVGWQAQPSALLIDAANFHLREGRWCRDRRFKDDYGAFLFGPNGKPYQFSESMADGVYAGYLVDGIADTAVQLLGSMQTIWNGWNSTTLYGGGYDASKGLFYIQPLTDATEYTISSIDASGGYDGFFGGYSFRPSINSYQWANALAISKLAAIKGDKALAREWEARAAAIKQNVQKSLWNSTFQHFIDRYQVNNENVTYWNFIRGRELVGYVPWAHDLPDDTEEYAAAWAHLLDPEKLAGPHGLRTVEPSYQYYMHQYRYEGPNPECQWNGPSWPYQTTQALTAMANLLDHYPVSAATGVISKADYTRLLQQYAELHYNPERGGILDLEEDYYPDTGYPIVGLTRSPHYFHSGFIDVVLSGFVGIRPRDDNILEVNPLADPASVSYFRVERIRYHGHDVAVQWDSFGDRYGTRGLIVEVDGKKVTSSPKLKSLTVRISRRSPPAVSRPIALSIQQGVNTEYPSGSVSVKNANANAVHAAIDGRVWFFPEPDVANGWDSPAGNGTEVWYQIDFGAAVQTGRAEIAFFANSTQGFAVPMHYRIETNQSGSWAEVSMVKAADAVANGITDVKWDSVRTSQIRLVFSPAKDQKVRLVELKVFAE
ncbi:six-hairpin glycosidase [Aspergillus floccosus]